MNELGQGPQGLSMTPDDLVRRMFDKPLGVWSTLGMSAADQFLQTPVAGTMARETVTPPLATVTEVSPTMEVSPFGDPLTTTRPMTRDEASARGDNLYATEAEYKSSVFYRSDIPWEPGMTAARAKALAEQYDISQVRRFYAEKRPYISFWGGVLGSIPEPTNFIPVVDTLGIAKFGTGIVARAIYGSADAALNTAMANTAMSREKARFGDDVSWETIAQNSAFAALAGAVIGGSVGAWGKYRAWREPPPQYVAPQVAPTLRPSAPRPEAAAPLPLDMSGQVAATFGPETRIAVDESGFGGTAPVTRDAVIARAATVDNQAKSAAVMNEAIHSFVNDGDVNLGPNARARVNEVADSIATQRPPTQEPFAGYRMFSPDELNVDARRFQFKEGGNDSGVSERLKGIGKWDRLKAGQLIVWEDNAGKFWVADGHQRVGLARRLQENGQSPKILGVVLREADGITAEQARGYAAAKNIAEGTGTAIDAAKVIRSTPGIDLNLPPHSALVRDAQSLAKLSDEAFQMVVNRVVPENQAAIVGRLAPDKPEIHASLMKVLADNDPANMVEAESMVRDALDAPQVQSTMEDIFGSAEQTQILYKERAQILAGAARQIKQDRGAFKTLIREEDRLSAAGNVLASEANAARLADDEFILAQIQKLSRRSGAIADALAAAASNQTSRPERPAIRPSEDFSMLSKETFQRVWNAGLKAAALDQWTKQVMQAGMSEEEVLAYLNKRRPLG
jgi:hypothetical protein